MGRPPKKKVKLTTDSFLQLTQEAYNELVEQRSTCIRTINENKKKVDVEDMHDLAGMNKANTDLLKIVDSTIDKKIGLVKLMSQFVFKGDSSESGDSGDLSGDDMVMIRDMFNNAATEDNTDKGNNIEYDI